MKPWKSDVWASNGNSSPIQFWLYDNFYKFELLCLLGCKLFGLGMFNSKCEHYMKCVGCVIASIV